MKRTLLHILIGVSLLIIGMVFIRWTAHANPPNGGFPIERVSVADDGSESDQQSIGPQVNRAGRYVVFSSIAALVPIDTNGNSDIFVRDTELGTTTRISVSSAEDQANGPSSGADISASGRYIVFESGANNLVSNDTNIRVDLFLRDRQLGTTTLLTEGLAGAGANGDSDNAVISSDGEYIAFTSKADNLVAGDTNGVDDCFVVEVATGAIGRVLTSTATELNAACLKVDISAGTPVVGFLTAANNVVPGDTNTLYDVFTVSIFNTNHQQISVAPDGTGANDASYDVSLSESGEYVAFSTFASNLVEEDTEDNQQVFVRDTINGTTHLVTMGVDGHAGNSTSNDPVISENGQRLAFISYTTNLVLNDTNDERDIFAADLTTGAIDRLSVSATGEESNDDSRFPAISHNGQVVVFESHGTNLVAGDTNSELDVFKSDIASFPPTPTPTATITPSSTPSATTTNTVTPSVTPTGTFSTPTYTATPTATPTGTLTPPTATSTPTIMATGTIAIPTETLTPTVTPTGTFSTPTETATPTVTPTGTLLPATATPPPDSTATPTVPNAQLYLPLVQQES